MEKRSRLRVALFLLSSVQTDLSMMQEDKHGCVRDR
jgi:hypothetical protein